MWKIQRAYSHTSIAILIREHPLNDCIIHYSEYHLPYLFFSVIENTPTNVSNKLKEI